ncbi:MAG: 50S ribosomal protein L15 [Actinobacteria bacterium]|nr:50S ribosomal protein L15 [Actinomycetota bacterium]MCG2796025.1 50S ribosomal protein L15 [Actinomycetes bacterium]MBU4241329.1 50S ribosomal protein L15 [Actinomycetota bacterium]MBU4301170.1 50S ribosomal protein L15 [Actinomycetota bacterium]MBU4385560.1 50S ribosomal protein L15 [Actinomycetota bacterium]
MRLHNLKPAPDSRKARKRVGRGPGAGGGGTAGRGHKGQNARSGSKRKPGFEGGQMPLVRRIPKLGGFTPRKRTVYALVNVYQLERFTADDVVDPAALAGAGLVKKERGGVKILGGGELSTSLTVKAHAFTRSAREKIEAVGGKAEVILGA